MNRWIRLIPPLARLGVACIVVAACVPLPSPTPPPAASSTTITDIVWQWTSVTDRPTGETTTVSDPQNYTIIFREDGTLSGQADCNTFTGTYSTDGGFSIASTPDVMAACGGDSLDVQYFDLLDAVAAGGPDGAGGLALETAGGEKRMLFVNGGVAPIPGG
jgi:heat shock protein HslJ